jgi:hypothetical protein
MSIPIKSLVGLLALSSPVFGGETFLDPVQEPISEPAAVEEATLFPVPDYDGDLWERSYLTGNWGGTRSRLAD